jgi:hypothetical protein
VGSTSITHEVDDLEAERHEHVHTSVDQSFNLQPITTAQILGDALRSRLADPVQREQAVQELMQSARLPAALTQPYSFYTNQVYQAQQLSGSVA